MSIDSSNIMLQRNTNVNGSLIVTDSVLLGLGGDLYTFQGTSLSVMLASKISNLNPIIVNPIIQTSTVPSLFLRNSNNTSDWRFAMIQGPPEKF